MRKFLSFSKHALAKADLTPEQYEAMLALKAFPGSAGLTIGQLGERLQVKHHTAVSLVDKLEAGALVVRERGVEDRRHVYVRLTATMRERSPEMIDALLRLRT
jgi:DNA-binding MarR family transcriptional regulator